MTNRIPKAGLFGVSWSLASVGIEHRMQLDNAEAWLRISTLAVGLFGGLLSLIFMVVLFRLRRRRELAELRVIQGRISRGHGYGR